MNSAPPQPTYQPHPSTYQPQYQQQLHQHQPAPPPGMGLSQPPPLTPTAASAFSSLAPDNAISHQDMAEQESQASALAAAGMVAETVSLTRPAVHAPTGPIQGLQAPPPLVGLPPPSAGHPGVMEAVNWNVVPELGTAQNVDDLDMDFATLFDPEQEQQYMPTELAGAWQASSSMGDDMNDMPDPSDSIPAESSGASASSGDGLTDYYNHNSTAV